MINNQINHIFAEKNPQIKIIWDLKTVENPTKSTFRSQYTLRNKDTKAVTGLASF